jgi:hypothetical protein
MRRLDFVPLCMLAALAGFVGAEAGRARPAAAATAAAMRDTLLLQEYGGAIARAPRTGRPVTDPRLRTVRNPETRRRLRLGQPGTYIGEILAGHDSSLARWPDHTNLYVWIQPSSAVRDWAPVFVDQVRDAFAEWEASGIPLRFTFVADSAAADVHVTWIDEFREPISGKTLWARDDEWWIVDADIALAVHHNGGDPLDAVAVRAIALHEVGHLIGLDHTRDPANIMTSKVRVRELSSADRATARLLYTLPAGSVR